MMSILIEADRAELPPNPALQLTASRARSFAF
jgi:hypothetical protein